MVASIQQQLVDALGAERPLECLRAVVQHLLTTGVDPSSVESELEGVRERLRYEGREDDEDVVLNVMDFLTGWCSPHMKISRE
jgi:hypothetical protein